MDWEWAVMPPELLLEVPLMPPQEWARLLVDLLPWALGHPLEEWQDHKH
jgi:hypothetical protein